MRWPSYNTTTRGLYALLLHEFELSLVFISLHGLHLLTLLQSFGTSLPYLASHLIQL